jgi:hypothetical protein
MRNLWVAYPGFSSGSVVTRKAEQSAVGGDPSIWEECASARPDSYRSSTCRKWTQSIDRNTPPHRQLG